MPLNDVGQGDNCTTDGTETGRKLRSAGKITGDIFTIAAKADREIEAARQKAAPTKNSQMSTTTTANGFTMNVPSATAPAQVLDINDLAQ